MELEQLKKVWDKTSEAELINHNVDRDELSWLITKKSKTTISYIKRNMVLKIGMSGLVGIFAIISGFSQLLGYDNIPSYLQDRITETELGFIMLIMGVVMIGISISTSIFYRRVKKFELSSDSLSVTIKKVTSIIESVMMLGLSSDIFVTPLLTGFFAYVQVYHREGFVLDSRAFIVLAVSVMFGVISYGANKWGMHKKFGKHLDKLKGYLNELEQVE